MSSPSGADELPELNGAPSARRADPASGSRVGAGIDLHSGAGIGVRDLDHAMPAKQRAGEQHQARGLPRSDLLQAEHLGHGGVPRPTEHQHEHQDQHQRDDDTRSTIPRGPPSQLSGQGVRTMPPSCTGEVRPDGGVGRVDAGSRQRKARSVSVRPPQKNTRCLQISLRRRTRMWPPRRSYSSASSASLSALAMVADRRV